MKEALNRHGLRFEVDHRNEKMGYKIRESQTQKVPYQLVVGDKEVEAQAVNVRRYGSKETETVEIDALINQIVAKSLHIADHHN